MTHPRRTHREHHPRLAKRWLTLIALAAIGCKIEGADACGAHQVYVEDRALLEYAVCVCDANQGYVFDQPRGYGCRQCEPGQSAVAGRCVSDDAGAPPSDAGGAGEPTGVGEYCESNADCADFDATYCAVQNNSCLIEACASGENTCGTATTCCDYSALLAGFSLCLPDAQLSDGSCPMGGKRVAP